jgi:serine/threonine-protein phosphatase 6 regulatory ankyrin repeat subunit B
LAHGARGDRTVWVDLFAVRQWAGSIADLNFRDVIGKCDAMIVSCSPVEGLKDDQWWGKWDQFLATPEGKTAMKRIPMFRLWCNVEIGEGVNRNLPVIVKSGQAILKEKQQYDDSEASTSYVYDIDCVGDMMSNLTHMIDVESSDCSSQADYDREMKIIKAMDGGVQRVNDTVQGVVVGADTSIELNVLEIASYMCGEKESLRQLKIDVGATGDERLLAIDVLQAACDGGRFEIVQELLQRWIGVTTMYSLYSSSFVVLHQDPYNLTTEDKVKWVQELIDESTVICSASSGGHANVVDLLLNVINVNVNVVNSSSGGTALCVASQNGHLNVVETLLKRTMIDVNKPSDTGMTPLLIASQHGYVKIVQTLLERDDIDVNKHSKKNQSPLSKASDQGHAEIVRLLLSKPNIDLNKTNYSSTTALGIAVENKHDEIVQLLIEAGAEYSIHNAIGWNDIDFFQQWFAKKDCDVNQTNESGETPLFIASSKAHVTIVQTLLTSDDIDVNKADESGETALYIASHEGHVKIVQTLLTRNDIDVNKPEEDGCTPLYIASQNKHIETVQALLTRDDTDVNKPRTDGVTPLLFSSQNGHVKIVQTLLTRDDIDVNKTDESEETALYIASHEGHFKVVQTLLTRDDIDVNKPDNDGETPLLRASSKCHVEVVRILLSRDDIDVNKHSKKNQTPLNKASDKGHFKVVRLLLSQPNIDLNKKDDWKDSPLASARNKKHNEIVQLLIEAGAAYSIHDAIGCQDIVFIMQWLNEEDCDVNQTNDSGWTPLLIACERGHVQIVQRLLSRGGIDVNKPEEDGMTPLILACYQGHVEVVQSLLSTPNIDLNKKDKWNDSPLSSAKKMNHVDIAQLLIEAGATPHIPFSRGHQDQVGVHTAFTCDNGHGLICFETPYKYGCSLCGKGPIPKGSVMYGCDECDYDVCATCESNSGETKTEGQEVPQ